MSLLKHYSHRENGHQEKNKVEVIVPFEEDTPKMAHKVLQHKRVMLEGESTLLYLVRYKNKGADHDEWLPENKIANAQKLLRQYRVDKKSS